MTILVTGANGQLGNEMRIVAKASKDSFIFTDVCDEHPESVKMLHKLAGDDVDISTSLLDITDLEAIRSLVKAFDVKVVVNCAAYTNVDAAEENYDMAESLNAKAPENLAIAMKEVNGLLVHISTDYVFGGDSYNTPCNENQKGTPTGVYGQTKLHGEEAIERVGCKCVILRTAWLYSEFGKNFVKTMLNLTATKSQLNVVFDQVGTPTFAYDLAMAIITILEDYKSEIHNSQLSISNYSKSGIYNFSNEGVCSWYDFARKIMELSGLNCKVNPIPSSAYPTKAKRPFYSVLDKSKIKQTFNLEIKHWEEGLKQCLKQL